MPHDADEQIPVRGDAVDLARRERDGEPLGRFLTGCAERDDLGQHGVVEGTDLGPVVVAGVDA